MLLLLCTVRDCGLELVREEGRGRLVCPRGHSFDIARSGYVNLLQPQDKRSRNPGDTLAAVAGRRTIHDAGVTRPLLDAIAEMCQMQSRDVVLDVGCGEGFYLGSLTREARCAGYGVDISIPAVDAAAKRYPHCQWTVANADRFLPFKSGAFSLLLSITGRMQPSAFARLLRPEDGRLLVALPAPDDLVELRGSGREDRVGRTITEFSPYFRLVTQGRAVTAAVLDDSMREAVLHSIYRPASTRRASPSQAGDRVTFSLDLLLFRPLLSEVTPL
jgi:SAM-dependent methyltransferase